LTATEHSPDAEEEKRLMRVQQSGSLRARRTTKLRIMPWDRKASMRSLKGHQSKIAVKLVRTRSREEHARAMRILSGFIIGGAMMALAKPAAFWVTGINYVNGT